MDTINNVEANSEMAVDAIESTASKAKGLFNKAVEATKVAAANPDNQKVAAVVGVVVAGGLIGYGLKKLWDRRQAKKDTSTARERAEAAIAAAKEAAEAIATK